MGTAHSYTKHAATKLLTTSSKRYAHKLCANAHNTARTQLHSTASCCQCSQSTSTQKQAAREGMLYALQQQKLDCKIHAC